MNDSVLSTLEALAFEMYKLGAAARPRSSLMTEEAQLALAFERAGLFIAEVKRQRAAGAALAAAV